MAAPRECSVNGVHLGSIGQPPFLIVLIGSTCSLRVSLSDRRLRQQLRKSAPLPFLLTGIRVFQCVSSLAFLHLLIRQYNPSFPSADSASCVTR